MKSIPTFKTFLHESERFTGDLTQEQIDFLDSYVFHKYHFKGNEPGKWEVDEKTGLVNVDGRFDISETGAKDFMGVRFGFVDGWFDCSKNNLTSLEGAPLKVGSMFNCSQNKLTSLQGGPVEVAYMYKCSENLLTSLDGIASKMKSLDCSSNKITSIKALSNVEWINPERIDISSNKIEKLEFLPKEMSGWFDCSSNALTSLDGSPKKVGGLYYCNSNVLRTLEGSPDEVDVFSCYSNNLNSLEGGPRKTQKYRCMMNPLISLKGAPIETDEFDCGDIIVKEGEWNLKTFFTIFIEGKPKARELISTLIDTSNESLDSYFTENPLDLYVLDEFPDLKSGVLKRTGMRDLSKMGRNLRSGLV